MAQQKHYIISGNGAFIDVESNLLKAINRLLSIHPHGWLKSVKSYAQYRRDFLRDKELNLYHSTGVMYNVKLVLK